MADIDGNGTEDPVLYRNGTWYASATHDGNVTHTFYFGGAANDVPLIGDVDGTGSPALFVYRQIGGIGYWYGSSKRDGVADRIYYFGGGANDIPALFDYDGDGKADLAIFRDGTWYVSTNRDGNANVAFIYGTAGDKPLYAGVGATSNQFLDAARFLTHASVRSGTVGRARRRSRWGFLCLHNTSSRSRRRNCPRWRGSRPASRRTARVR